MGGWFYGVTHGLGVKNIYLRREQFRLADVPAFCLRLARALVAGKIRNQRTMLQRNHIEPPPAALAQMKCMADDAERAEAMDQLLGIEGNAARVVLCELCGHDQAAGGRAGQIGRWPWRAGHRRSGVSAAIRGTSRSGVMADASPFTFDFTRPQPAAAARRGECVAVAGV